MAARLGASERMEIARAFLAQVSWGLVNMRATRAYAGGEAKFLWHAFAKGAPRNALKEVLSQLSAESTVTDPLVDGSIVPGVWYHKTSTWYKDSQSSRNGDSTQTLVRFFSDGPLTETYVVETGCSTITTIKYVFDAVTVEAAPAARQGFDVKIGGVQRDKETGFYSYQVVTTEEVTKTLGEIKTGEDAFSEDYAKQTTGLRGTVTTPLHSDGTPLNSLADDRPENQPVGTLANTSWEENRTNCTLATQTRKKKAKTNVVAGGSSQKDLFGTEVGVKTVATTPLGDAPEPAAGVIISHVDQLRPDLLSDTSKQTKTERTVLEAEVATSEDLYKKSSRKSHKSVTAAGIAALTPAAAVGKVVSLQVGKTPGDMRDAGVSETEEKEVTEAEVTQAKTIFVDSTKTAHKSITPAAAALLLPSAAAGKKVSVQVGKTPGNLRDASVTEEQELEVRGASVSRSVNKFQTQTQTTDKSVPAAEADALVPSATAGLVTSYQIAKSEGDLRNVVKNEEQELSVPNAVISRTVTPFGVRVEESDKSAAAARALADGEFGTISDAATPGGLHNTSKVTETAVIGAVASGSFENNYLVNKSETETIVGAPPTSASSTLVGRVLTKVSYVRDSSTGAYRQHTTVETAPAARKFTLTDSRITYTAGDLNGRTDERTRIIMFLQASPAEVSAEAEAFIGLVDLGPFSTPDGLFTTYYWSYRRSISFGLQPDEFGLWSGTLTMHAKLANERSISTEVLPT